jgi:hypothetical protein
MATFLMSVLTVALGMVLAAVILGSCAAAVEAVDEVLRARRERQR